MHHLAGAVSCGFGVSGNERATFSVAELYDDNEIGTSQSSHRLAIECL